MIAGSYRVVGKMLPKSGDVHAPHSPLAAPLVRSHCGTKSPGMPPGTAVASFHGRCVCVRTVVAGLLASARLIEFCMTLRLALPLIAVLPVPNTSYAKEMRGSTSFQF